jgi:hypothetical protein
MHRQRLLLTLDNRLTRVFPVFFLVLGYFGFYSNVTRGLLQKEKGGGQDFGNFSDHSTIGGNIRAEKE